MSVRSPFIACALLASLPLAAGATTWGANDVDDPIQPGTTCHVQSPRSSGSYIYGYPSKWDQVFWPVTEAAGIWFCPGSGFTALIGDFDGMSDAEKTAIREWLGRRYDVAAGETDLRKRLELLEGIYAVRDKDAQFRNLLLRVLAYWHDAKFDDPAGANAYRLRALKEIRAFDPATLKTQQRLAHLFVAANYERELGNTIRADADLDALEAALKAVGEDDDAHGYAEYLRDLVDGSRKIAPGGALAPGGEKDAP